MAKINYTQDVSHHPLHYFTLLCLELVGLWGIFWFSYSPAFQIFIVFSMCVFYVIWGIFHHHQHKNLHPKIIFEYILIAAMGFLLFSSLLLRA